MGFRVIHPDDLSSFNESLQESLNNLSLWYHKYRVKAEGDGEKWHSVRAWPEIQDDDSVIWYESFQDISSEVK